MADIIPELPDNPHRLGRHVNHDPRSLQYPFSARPEAEAAVVAKEWKRQAPVFDQGNLGSCTGNAGEGWEASDNAVRPGIATKVESDAVQLYSDATKIDPYQGTYPPTDTGSDGLSIAKVLKTRGTIDQYTHGLSINDLKVAVQATPTMLGTNWYQGMFNPDSNGVVSISGNVAGGHEYLCVGYDADGSLGYPAPFKFTNSWGPGWGVAGYFFMDEATVTRLLSEQGDVTVLHAVGGPAPVPPKPPKPSPAVLKYLDALITWLKSL